VQAPSRASPNATMRWNWIEIFAPNGALLNSCRHSRLPIQRDEAEFRGGRVNGRRAPPIDEAAEDAAVTKIWKNSRHPRVVEGEELGVGHFAGRHGEFAMAATLGRSRRSSRCKARRLGRAGRTAAPALDRGRFITAKPQRSKCSTRRLATIDDMSSSARRVKTGDRGVRSRPKVCRRRASGDASLAGWFQNR
jgi:hypothetical protein